MRKWMLVVFALEITVFAVLMGIYVHHRHYQSDRYSYIVLAKEHESYQMGLKWDSLRSYFAFMVLGDLNGKTAIEYSASFCTLIIPCLNDKDRAMINEQTGEQYALLKAITEYRKQRQ